MRIYNVSHYTCCQVDYDTPTDGAYSDPDLGTVLCPLCFEEVFPHTNQWDFNHPNIRDAWPGSASSIVNPSGTWEFSFESEDWDEGVLL